MNLLTVENLEKTYGTRKLFDNTSFSMQEGEKVGVIGINGTGKSTLLKMLAGLEEPDEGTVTVANHAICSYLPQNPVFDEKETAMDAVLAKYAQSGQTAAGEGDLETRAKTMLTRLGVTEFDTPCGQMSGGQKKRLALVAALLYPSDLLILDEPTNHLDSDMAQWLEEQLRQRTGALIMVTHDRYFLDCVTDRIVEIDRGKIYSYQGNYAVYLDRKAQREESSLASERKRQSILRKELEWVRRGARARSTKQKARLERYEELKNTEAPIADGKVETGFAASARLGKTTVEISHVSKGFGDRLLIRDFSYVFLKDDRIGFVGKNGCGKTTLMKMLMGLEEPCEGRIVIGQTVKLGYYAQEIGEEEMSANQSVIDFIRDTAEFVDTQEGKVSASKMLERFLFEGKDQYGLIGKLSGGERRRLYLLKVLMEAPNVLILDEPTNDLDISTLTVLEDYLDSFGGIVIVVSHDRYFLDRTVRRIFAFEEGGILRQHEGGYTDYHGRLRREAKEGGTPSVSGRNGGAREERRKGQSPEERGGRANSWKQPSSRLKFTYREQKEYETIEDEIAALEEKLEALKGEILASATDFVKLNRLTGEKAGTEKLLEEKMDRWMYLEDLKARIDAQNEAR